MLIHLRLHHIILYIIADHTLAYIMSYWMTLCCIIYFSLILGNANFSND